MANDGDREIRALNARISLVDSRCLAIVRLERLGGLISGKLRREIYAHMLECVHRIRPNLDVALCLEENSLWQDLNLQASLGRCNCVL